MESSLFSTKEEIPHSSTSTHESHILANPNLNKQTSKQLNVDLKGTLLTPLACASLINELLKTLIFQKSQIPFPYNWLKSVIERRRKAANQECAKQTKAAVERYYKLASSTYDNLEDIMCHIKQEIEKCEVQEVVILFGTTPLCPKQVYSLKLPPIVRGHLEGIHQQSNSKNQHNVLRQILLSDEWTDATQKTMPSTNMYVMLKKTPDSDATEKSSVQEDHFFLPSKKFSLSTRIENIVINFQYINEEKHNCCSHLEIFEDVPRTSSKNVVLEAVNSCDNSEWYQAKTLVTGFKDYYVGKISASDLW